MPEWHQSMLERLPDESAELGLGLAELQERLPKVLDLKKWNSQRRECRKTSMREAGTKSFNSSAR